MHRKKFVGILAVTTLLTGCFPPKDIVDPSVPIGIATPSGLQTHLGMIELFDGTTDRKTAQKMYDHLDLQRATSVYLNNLPLASMGAMRTGILEFGKANSTALIFEDFLNSQSLWLTPNATSVYFTTWLELTPNEAMVIESPTNILGFIDDHFFKYVTDLGNLGPDKGQGGKYLVLPPDYKGEIPQGYYVIQAKTYGNWVMGRGFAVDGDPKPAVKSIKESFRVYPLNKGPIPMNFINTSDTAHNTIHRSDSAIFDEINAVIQAEPLESFSTELLGQLAAIGIKKGKEFAPDLRMQGILKEAANIGAATIRSLVAYPRDPKFYIYYPDSSVWINTFADGYQFKDGNARDLDSRSIFHFYATGITPAMSLRFIGKGSQYAYAYTDADGKIFDGSKTYKINLPPNVPAKDNWSFTVYDSQTRAMLKTSQPFATVSSDDDDIKQNADGSYDIYFAPTPPKGLENNWIQTVPGKSWNTLFRLYGPLEPWFNKSWRLSDPVLVK